MSQAPDPRVARDLCDAIGETPLIRLRGPSEATGCEILGKAEFMNPAGSVKDRAALFMVRDAFARGDLREGGWIVEATSGNTGIGLAQVGNALGARCLIVIPKTQSQEKKDALRLCGAELREVPAVPYRDPENYVHVAARLADSLREREGGNVFYANQWDNPSNRRAHFEGTGPEIWRQTGGAVDAFTCAIGTGGTLSGVGLYLKSQRADIQIALSDPCGASLVSYFQTGELRGSGSSIMEGIGQGRVTGNVDGAPVDRCYEIPDAEALPVIFALQRDEGLCLGGSSGINVAGAIRLARELGPGHTVVTVLCDSGTRYQSKLFNPEFLRAKGLPTPSWLDPASDAPAR